MTFEQCMGCINTLVENYECITGDLWDAQFCCQIGELELLKDPFNDICQKVNHCKEGEK